MVFNQRLDIQESLGTGISYRFRNDNYKNFKGRLFGTAFWANPLARYDISKVWFNRDQYDYISSFIDSIQGSGETFRFRDPLDYSVDALSVQINNLRWQGRLFPQPDGIITQFQAYKQYISGQGTLIEINRPIFFIDSMVVIVDGLAVTGVTYDNETGVVTFPSPPSVGETLRWIGRFDTPVYLNEDKIVTTIISYDKDGNALYRLENLVLEESRLTPTITVDQVNVPRETIDHTFGLDTYFNTSSFKEYQANQYRFDSGFVSRKPQRTIPLNQIQMGKMSNLVYDHAAYLAILWRVCIGTISGFRYDNPNSAIEDLLVVRFAMDSLNFTVTMDNGNEFLGASGREGKLFEVDGLAFEQNLSQVDDLQFLCHLFKFTRTDSQVFGFTDHSDTIIHDNVVYHPSNSLNATATSQTNDSEPSNLSANTVTSDLITENDLISGKWKRARQEIITYNWNNRTVKEVSFIGFIGSVTACHDANEISHFGFESLDIKTKLEQKWLKVTNLLCDKEFGNLSLGGCRFDIPANGLQLTATVTLVYNRQSFECDLDINTGSGGRGDYYNNLGTITFISGENNGNKGSVLSVVGNRINLWYNLPYYPVIGDAFVIIPGCKKDVDDCANKYNNIINHGGFPLLPGNDKIAYRPR